MWRLGRGLLTKVLKLRNSANSELPLTNDRDRVSYYAPVSCPRSQHIVSPKSVPASKAIPAIAIVVIVRQAPAKMIVHSYSSAQIE